MSRFTVARSYVPSSTGKSKLLKFEVIDASLVGKMDGTQSPVVATFTSQAKADAHAAELNATPPVAGGSGETEAKEADTTPIGTAPEKETPAQEARRLAHELGFNKYAIRRYRYYKHLVDDEHMKESDAQAAAATATRHTLWPFRMTREELRASA